MAQDYLKQATKPERLWSRSEVLAQPSPVPREPGLYAWYFKTIPPTVPTDTCNSIRGLTLLYCGISPKAPPKDGKKASEQTLWNRIRYHFNGNAESSTLRLTLGTLLAKTLGIELRRVGRWIGGKAGGGEHNEDVVRPQARVDYTVESGHKRRPHKIAILRLIFPPNLVY